MGVQINGDTGNISATKADYSGNVTIGGTLTYEDVTNIDSVGLVTARSGLEIGARPGVAASISVDGNMIISGISTFGDDITFTGATSGRDVVFDTSLNQIRAQDNAKLCAGSSSDLEIYHTGSASYIDNYTGALYLRNNVSSDVNGDILIQAKSGENSVACYDDGSVELYYDNARKFRTVSDGVEVNSAEGGSANLALIADEGDDNADYWRLSGSTDGSLYIQNYTSGSWEKNLKATGNAGVDLYYDNSKKLEVTNTGVTVTGTLAATAVTGDGSAMTGITTGPYGNYQYSTWYTTTDFDPGADNATIENWAETNAQGYVRLGTAPSYSSGVFTFPSTGYWRIHANLIYYHTTATGDTLSFAIRHSTDSGSSFNNVASTGARLDGGGPNNTKLCWSVTATIKCDNVSTNRFDIRGIGFSSTAGRIMGGSNANDHTSAGCNMHIEKMANL